MVISCVIKGFMVHNVLVNTCSVADIIIAKAFKQMQEPKDKIHDSASPLWLRGAASDGTRKVVYAHYLRLCQQYKNGGGHVCNS
jgi:hypothetical protein